MVTEPIKVTVSDPDTGEVLDEQVVDNNYLLICAGNRYLAYENVFANGTAQLTVKVDRDGDGS